MLNELMEEYDELTSDEIKEKLEVLGISVGLETIRKTFKMEGYFSRSQSSEVELTIEDRRRRVEWA